MRPGTVTVGGSPAPNSWQPGNVAGTSLSVAGTALGATMGIGMAVGATAEGGALATGTALGSAIPIAGVGIVIAGAIIGMLRAHHAAALAAEGKALNDADARAMNAFVLVLQGVLVGEISDLATAQGHLDTIVSDWYGEVKHVQRGTWHYTGQDLTADYQKVWIRRTQPARGAPGFSDYHAPDPCNGACVMGHFFIERGRLLVLAAANDALGGNHGVLVLPAIPAHQTQSGFPEVRAVY